MSTLQEELDRMQRHIQPLDINGLKGRVLKIDPSKSTAHRDILMVYGHHSSLERMFGIAEAFSQFGTVTMPDLPGFGGMDSFYALGMEPTIDAMADYLATFVKLRYRRKKVTIVAMSFGFVVATRMLQRYPDLVKKVDLILSLVGFAHKSDFSFSAPTTALYKALCSTFSRKIPASVFYHTALQPWVIKTAYEKMPNARSKFQHTSGEEKKRMLDFEAQLWRANDVRTHAHTNRAMFSLDNCTSQIALPVHHVAVDSDQYFDRAVVEQHLRIIFTDYIEYLVSADAHAPSIVASKEDAEGFIPDTLKTVLRKSPKARRKK